MYVCVRATWWWWQQWWSCNWCVCVCVCVCVCPSVGGGLGPIPSGRATDLRGDLLLRHLLFLQVRQLLDETLLILYLLLLLLQDLLLRVVPVLHVVHVKTRLLRREFARVGPVVPSATGFRFRFVFRCLIGSRLSGVFIGR